MKTHTPSEEIKAANPWYLDDQFEVQLGSAASRDVVQNRWRVFERTILGWCGQRGAQPTFVLDAGCGDGINLQFLRRLVSSHGWPAQVIGVDYNPVRLRRAMPRCGTKLFHGSLTALPFTTACFDLVLCNHVLEHVPDDRGALVELQRVLKPAGLLIVAVPNEGAWLGTLRNRVFQRSILHSTDHVHMYSESLLLDRIRAVGLQVLDVHREGFFVPHTFLHRHLQQFTIVRRLLAAIARFVPSCAAGLIIMATPVNRE